MLLNRNKDKPYQNVKEVKEENKQNKEKEAKQHSKLAGGTGGLGQGRQDSLIQSNEAAKLNIKAAKLVRDKVPDIINRNGAKPIIRIADDEEYVYALKHKIVEEANELKEAKSESNELEEIIDIMEAVNAYIKHRNVSVQAADRMRKHKLRRRGGFDRRIILEGVEKHG